jgi:transcriptional antiterminator Rof (Rho-off)
VTQDESDLFKGRAHDYPLAIELVQRPDFGERDQYTANARVVIRKQGQEVLNAQAEGPFMLVRLDPGTYEIAATLGERTLLKQSVVVRNGQSTHTVFVFPAGTG